MEKGDYIYEKLHLTSDGRAKGSTRTAILPNIKVKYV